MPVALDWGSFATETPRSPEAITHIAQDLLAQMSLAEKVSQLSGDVPRLRSIIKTILAYNFNPIPAAGNTRLGVPPVLFTDGPRGVVMYHSTCFPSAMARGATWNTALEQRVGEAIGIEARAQGANLFAGVCINLLRHPAWGRAQETYGEDTHHLGEMGAAMVQGVQQHIMACIKHFACNSIEEARFKVNVEVDERSLREVYLPHFKRCVDAGAASVMSAYNKVRGEYCGHNHELLTQILKEEWGFDGFVISDFGFGVRNGKAAVLAGMDIEMPHKRYIGQNIEKMVEDGSISIDRIDDAVLRILRKRLTFAQIKHQPQLYNPAIVASPAHRELAREVAQEAIVLLQNNPPQGEARPLLPLQPDKIKKIAVFGRLALLALTGDMGSSKVRATTVVPPLVGIQAALGQQAEVIFYEGKNLKKAAALAAQADVCLICVGNTHRDEGEYILIKGGDRDRLTLASQDEQLISSIAAANARTVVSMIGGSAFITENWRTQVAAILMQWYAGMEGGHALADILLGKVNPSAKLPCSFPREAAHLPFFDKHADRITYGYHHGYHLLAKQNTPPAFAFGFGLSYTTFIINDLRLSNARITTRDTMHITATLHNTGTRAGAEVVQLYIGYQGSAVERHTLDLKGFQKISLEAGQSTEVHFALPAAQLAYYDANASAWRVEAIRYHVYVGTSSRVEDCRQMSFEIID